MGYPTGLRYRNSPASPGPSNCPRDFALLNPNLCLAPLPPRLVKGRMCTRPVKESLSSHLISRLLSSSESSAACVVSACALYWLTLGRKYLAWPEGFLKISERANPSMLKDDSQIYEFGDYRLDLGKQMLSRAGVHIPLTRKVFETLHVLVKRAGQVIEKEDLIRVVWPDAIVEENNLNQNISTLRRVLGESRGDNRYIATVSGRGYRFVPEVRIHSSADVSQLEHIRIAVLPFENIGAGSDREYLAEGLTEETIASLGQIDPQRISVIGRTSVMSYKRTVKTLAEIGKELDATYLVESSLRAEGERLRITAKLIRVRDQLQIWSASYDSEPNSMLALQRELSQAIAEQVRLRLSPERLRALGRRQTQNAEAYNLYLHGRHFWQQLSPPTNRKAIEYFTHATELDPNYALAWSGLADCYTAGPVNGDAPPQVVWPRARETTMKALKAEPDLAEVQTSLGSLKFWLDWEWTAAETAYRKAVQLDPSYPLAHRMLGVALSHMGAHEEAQAAIRRARELDPLYVMHQSLLANCICRAKLPGGHPICTASHRR